MSCADDRSKPKERSLLLSWKESQRAERAEVTESSQQRIFRSDQIGETATLVYMPPHLRYTTALLVYLSRFRHAGCLAGS